MSFRSSLASNAGDSKQAAAEATVRVSSARSNAATAALVVAFPSGDKSISAVSLAEKDAEMPTTPVRALTSVFGPSPTPAVSPVSPAKSMVRKRSQTFTTRRRQATKLTRLLGLDYPDLYQAMVLDDPTPPSPTYDDLFLDSPITEVPPTLPFVSELLAKRGSLSLGMNGGPSSILKVDKDAANQWSVQDPQEVKMLMDRLREMKA